jgi:MFS family permease
MGRKILAVILGYVVMAVVIMGGLTVVYFALGQDTVFEAGTYEVTGLWIVVWALASVVAALAGGFVCGKIGKSKGAVISLVVLIAVLGAANTAYMMTRETPPEDLIRAGDTSSMEAMTKAQAPTWMYIAEPLIGVFGAMVGASMGCGCRKDGCSVEGGDSAA